MSRAPLSPDEKEAIESWTVNENNTLTHLMREGQSFSGRERNSCFLNTGGKEFANVSACSGLDYIDDGRSIARVDWDHDGDLDLWLANRSGPRVRFMRNDTVHENHFIAFRLQGNGTTTNRDAIGARVELLVRGDDRKRVKTVYGGSGFQSQSSRWVTFGLGEANDVEKVIVRWPAGESEEFTGLQADAWYRLVQGSGMPESWTPPEREVKLVASPTKVPLVNPSTRTMIVAPYPMPSLEYQDFEDQTQTAFLQDSKQPVLVNLWGTWCGPCREELKEWSDHAEQIRAAGLDIVALNVDGMGDSRGMDQDGVRRVLERLKFPFRAGEANHQMRSRIQFVYDAIYSTSGPLPLPLSLLIDTQGDLSVIYKGQVSIDQLLEDVKHLSSDLEERRRLAQPYPGPWFGKPFKREIDIVAENFQRLGYVDDAAVLYRRILAEDEDNFQANMRLGVYLQRQGKLPDAIRHFRRVIAVEPTLEAHTNLAAAFQQLGQLEEAARQYELALKLQDENVEARLGLANLLMEQQKVRPAIAEFEKVIEQDPLAVEAYMTLSSLLRRLGRFEEAAATCQLGLDNNPDDKLLLFGMGAALVEQKKWADAVTHFEKAIQIDPDFQPAQEGLQRARSQLEKGE